MRTDAEAREQILQITNELFAMGLLTPTGGNISARAADPELYWITPSRMYKGGLTQDDLVCIKSDGTVLPWYMPGSRELADAVGEALKASRGAILQCHGLMSVGKTMRDAATRAMMLEETAKIVLYCKQFGGELTLIPPEWVERLAVIAEFI